MTTEGEKKKKVSGMMLSGAKALEEQLARRESRELEESLPEGHPLRQESERRRAEDLEDLPPGHPMRRAMEEARLRYEETAADTGSAAPAPEDEDDVGGDDGDTVEASEPTEQDAEDVEEKARKLRRAKKLDQQKVRQERIAREVEAQEERHMVAGAVNSAIADVMSSLQGVYKVLATGEKALETDQYCKMKAMKLKRLLYAVERGLYDCRMTRI